MQREVRVGGEGGGRGVGHGLERQRRQRGVVVGVAEERNAVAAASASVRSGWDYHAVHLKNIISVIKFLIMYFS